MNAIITMAGFGTRFSTSGWKVPKPLIDVQGKPMFYYSVSSLPLKMFTSIIFVLRNDQNTELYLSSIEEYFSQYPCSSLLLDKSTRGQAETVYLATELIDPVSPIVVHNCDTAFTASFPKSFFTDNNLLLFSDDDPRWSFARIDKEGNVLQTTEKIPISNFASTGTYSFQSSQIYRDIYESYDKQDSSENFIAPMYNEIIKKRGHVGSLFVREIFCMGTPDDLSKSVLRLSNWAPNDQLIF